MTQDNLATAQDSYWANKVYDYIYQTSLPLWCEEGFNRNGGFVESLSFNARPDGKIKRLRVHGRQTFIMLYLLRNNPRNRLLPYLQQTKDRVIEAQQFLNNYQSPIEHLYSTLVDNKGDVVNGDILPYDHTFLMMGFGELWLATEDDSYAHKAEYIYRQLKQYFQNSDGSFTLSATLANYPPLKLNYHSQEQNHHMHMFEACLSLYETTHLSLWLERAHKMFALLEKYFFNSEQTLLHEYFHGGWTIDSQKGMQLQPGHYYEWVWLLQRYQSLCGGNETAESIATKLYAYANKYGSNDPDTGLIVDEMMPKGEPLRQTKRLWVQAEALKAHISMCKRSARFGDSASVASITQTIETLLESIFQYYLDPHSCGVWYDQLDATNMNISLNAPASTAYHILLALHEYLKLHSYLKRCK